jgi:hypothetical protein
MFDQAPGRRSLLGAVAALAVSPVGFARAEPLAKPAGAPILTISGKIGQTNDGAVARFDRPLLESLGTKSFITSTPWHDSPVQFEGVPMERVMQSVAASGQTIKAIALDDYACELPIADFARFGTLLALKMDGRYLTVKDKGPSFIIYPFDQFAELRSAKYYSRSVWQLASIDVI